MLGFPYCGENMIHTKDNTGKPRPRFYAFELTDPAQIREQAEQKAQTIKPPALESMAQKEIQEMFYETQVKKLEAELQIEQLQSWGEKCKFQAELLATVTENMLDMAVLSDLEGNITFAGGSYKNLGYDLASLMGKNVLDFVHPEDLSRVTEAYKELVLSANPFRVEYRCRCRDGSYIWLDTRGRIVTDEGDNFKKIVFNSRDITEQKRTEEVLQEKEERYRLLVEASNDIVWTFDLSSMRYTYCSKSVETILGYSQEEVNNFKLGDIHPPETKKRVIAAFDKVFRGESNSDQVFIDAEHRRKNGSLVWMEISAVMHRDNQGRPVSFTGVSRDITERKQAEDALRESEEKYRLLIDNLNEGIWQIDKDGYTIFVNDSMAEMLGYTVQEMQGKHLFEFMDAQEVQLTKKYMQRRQKGIKEQHEHTLVCRDGSYIFTNLETSPIYDKDSKYIGAIAGVQDVTDRKQAEEALRQSENYYRAIFENSGSAMFIIEEDATISHVNSNFEKMLGYAKQEVEGKKFWTEFIHADDVGWMKKNHYLRRSDPRGAPLNYEFRFFARNGDLRHGFLTVDIISGTAQSVASVIDITERKQAIEELKERESFIKATLDNLPVGVAVNSVDPEVRFAYMNDNFARFYRTTREALDAPNDFWEVVYTDATFREQIKKRVLEDCASNDPERMYWEDIPVSRPGKKPFYITAKNIPLPENNLMVSTVWDVTNRKRAEEEQEKLQKQLAQAQKMESVGRLAGGVAHDFNNKLSIINGYAELAMEAIDSSDPLQETIQEIYTAGQQSAGIVRQLLAFARKQTISPVLLDLNDTISSMLKMLQRLIGENIDLAWHPGKNLWPVKIDPSQVDQIMANLAVNSRDAISDVGKLTIETDNIVVDEDYCRNNPEAIPGQYVMLAVSDNGCGIEEEIREQLFDPYFTTKEVGKGTGLGLPTVYGIVKQNNGFINVYSEPGEGTTFKLSFPSREETKPSLYSAKKTTGQIPTGTETVLVVEDEKTILQMSKQMLERLGYTVETAGSPAEALQISNEYDGTIHLLVTDVVMPEMNGRDLSGQMVKSHPGLKTLYMSGYTADVIAHHGVLDEGLQFIQKPFSLRDLALKVREVIDQE